MLRYLKRFTRPLPARRSLPCRPRLSWPQLESLEERRLLTTVNVHAGDDLQAILWAAKAGDTLILDAGATFTGPIILPNKSSDQWITIESSAQEDLPAPGQRVGPEDAVFMPKIVSPGLAAPALQTDAGAHNYRLQGIEFLPATPDAFIYDLIDLGDGSYAQTSLDQVPYNLILDQCYIHAWPGQDLKRGIALNSAATSILDSTIADFKSEGLDSQAIAGWNGPGPFQIENNYLEAAGENILFGGDLAKIPNLVPSNIQILGNEFFKPLSWRQDDPSYAGTPWTVKNLLELKSARHVLIEGNLFENNWHQAQNGFAILFTVRDQNGLMPWAAVEDITFQDNILLHVAGGFDISGLDTVPSARTQHIVIRDNLVDDMSDVWGDNGILVQILDKVNDIVVDHNTAFPTKTILAVDGLPSTGLVYENNITSYGDYGIKGTGTAPGTDSLSRFLPDAVVVNNVFVGQPDQAALYPAGNFFPAALDDVGFVDLAAGNYRLADSSSYKNAGTDGADLGADIDAILAAMNTDTVPEAPTNVTAVPVSASEVDLAWKSVAGALAYEIERSPDGDSGWVQIAVTVGSVTFQDTGLTAGTTWFYRVRASNLAGDSGYSDPVSATTLTPSTVSSLVLAGPPSSLVAGTAASFSVTATDAQGNPVAGYRGTVHFRSSDPQAVLPADYTFTATDNGVHTFSIILKTAGTASVTVADTVSGTLTGTLPGITVIAAPASSFVLAGFPSSLTAGAAVAFTVTAIDPYGNTATGYLGTVRFGSSDGQAALPGDYAFTPADKGTHTLTMVLKTASTASVTATDTTTSSITGIQPGILIVPASATAFRVTGFPSPATAGVAGSFTVTATDAYGNTATGYRGTVRFSTADSQATVPGNYTFTATDNGVHSFTATFNTGGTWSLTASDTGASGITGTQTAILVNSVVTVSRLVVAGIPASLPAGTSALFTVTATDASGKTVTGYRGTVHFSSSDGQADLPANFVFTAADNGVHTFVVTFKTAGSQTLTVADTATRGIGTQANAVVSPAAARTFLVAGFPLSVVQGVAHAFTVTAKDPFGNTATGYRGTVRFASSDRAALLPANYTFTAADNGVHSFSATLQTTGTQSLSVADTVTSTLIGTESGIVVTRGGGGGAPPPSTGLKTDSVAEENLPAVAGTALDSSATEGELSSPSALPTEAAAQNAPSIAVFVAIFADPLDSTFDNDA